MADITVINPIGTEVKLIKDALPLGGNPDGLAFGDSPKGGLAFGGPGSGNWGHAGRKGKRGGSMPRESGMSVKSGKDWMDRYKAKSGKDHPHAKVVEEDRKRAAADDADAARKKKRAEAVEKAKATRARKKAEAEAAAKAEAERKAAEEAKRVEARNKTGVYYDGDPTQAKMQALFDGLPKDVQDLARESGIIALDKDTAAYVRQLMADGKLASVASGSAYLDEVAGIKVDDVKKIIKDASADIVAFENALGPYWQPSSRNYDAAYEALARALTMVRAAAPGGNIREFFGDSWRSSKEKIISMASKVERGDRDSVIEGIREFAHYGYGRGNFLSAMQEVVYAAALNKVAVSRGFPSVFRGEDIAADAATIYQAANGKMALRIKSDFGDRTFASISYRYRSGKLDLPSSAGKASGAMVSSMLALRKATPFDAKVQEGRIARTFDSSVHSFSYTVKGVYEIVPQDSVRAAYAKIEAAKDHILEAFHGTHYEAARGISSTGFRVPKVAKSGRMMGNGVYLASKSSKSIQYISQTFGRYRVRGVLMMTRAARGREMDWSGVVGRRSAGDTTYGRLGQRSGSRRLLNEEWVVHDGQAVLPRFWIDTERW